MLVMKQQIASIVMMAAANTYRTQEHSTAEKKLDKLNGKRKVCLQI
jgi:hypothetical protein